MQSAGASHQGAPQPSLCELLLLPPGRCVVIRTARAGRETRDGRRRQERERRPARRSESIRRASRAVTHGGSAAVTHGGSAAVTHGVTESRSHGGRDAQRTCHDVGDARRRADGVVVHRHRKLPRQRAAAGRVGGRLPRLYALPRATRTAGPNGRRCVLTRARGRPREGRAQAQAGSRSAGPSRTARLRRSATST